jgi:hypothetical protein
MNNYPEKAKPAVCNELGRLDSRKIGDAISSISVPKLFSFKLLRYHTGARDRERSTAIY